MSQNLRYVGLDVHKKIVQACILDPDGEVTQTRFPCTREQLDLFAEQRLRPEDRVVLEASTNTWGVVEILRRHVADVAVSNPMLTKAIASAKIKTDKVDAYALASLLRSDYLPVVWEPDERTRSIRREISIRAALVADRTRLKNRIHSALAERLIVVPVDDLFSVKGRQWLSSTQFANDVRIELVRWLELLDATEHAIQLQDDMLVARAYDDPRIKLLMTLPGVSYAVALCLISVLGDINRFRDPDRAASYVGLVPSTHQSADKCYHGPITKRGNSHARWMLVQAAQHLADHPGPLGHFFRRLASKKNRNVAVVATARKLVTIAWHMLRNNEPYRYAQPLPTQNKLSKLRVRATGIRRRSGTAKGQPRPASYGSGKQTRLRQKLSTVYSSEDLPPARPVDALPAGEKSLLERTHSMAFAQSINEDVRIPKKRLPKKTAASPVQPRAPQGGE